MKVFVTIANGTHVNYAKAVFYAASTLGRWDGDFLFIASHPQKDDELDWFRQRGIHVLKAPPMGHKPNWDCLLLIDPFFLNKWDDIVYFDTDILIHLPLHYLLTGKTSFALDGPSTVGDLFYEKNREAMAKYFDLNQPSLQAGVIVIHSISIKTPLSEFGRYSKYQPFSPHCDQLFWNLAKQEGKLDVHILPEIYNYVDAHHLGEKDVVANNHLCLGKPWWNQCKFHKEWQHNMQSAETMSVGPPLSRGHDFQLIEGKGPVTRLAAGDGLASKFGSNWKRIYEHPGNKYFRMLQPNPDHIMAGSWIFVPDEYNPSGSGE